MTCHYFLTPKSNRKDIYSHSDIYSLLFVNLNGKLNTSQQHIRHLLVEYCALVSIYRTLHSIVSRILHTSYQNITHQLVEHYTLVIRTLYYIKEVINNKLVDFRKQNAVDDWQQIGSRLAVMSVKKVADIPANRGQHWQTFFVIKDDNDKQISENTAK